MLRNIYKIVACGAILMFIHACEDKLEIVDPNRLASAEFYQNEDQAIAAVDAIYNALIIDGLYQRMTPAVNDGRSDEISCRSPWVFLTGFSAFTVPATDGANEIMWAGYYIMVARTNQALENIPNVPDVDENLRNRLMGQAYFLRAFAYFNLTNMFDKVPHILEVPAGQEAFYPSNANVTQEMIFDQAQADLEMAINMLPVNYNGVSGPDQGQVGRATKGAALSLLGKLHLYRGNYSQAAGYFKQVIDLNEYSLAPNYADLFSDDPTKERANPGKIFWAEFTTSNNSDFNWGGDPNVNWRQFIALAPTYSVADFFDFYPTNFLYNEMRQESTIDGKLDPRYHATILSYEPDEGYTTAYGADWFARGFAAGDYFIKKFTKAATGGDPFTAGFNYHIIRYADVLLMYAESLANTNNIAEAARHVQTVRDRANLPDREAEFAAFTLSQFMNQLAHERIMELAIEGSRWHDIRRWGWLEDATRLNELKSHDFEFNTFTPERHWMPIPQTELDRNANLVGNSANQ
jgi:starch-binding outer membrane protein, SusD/RagB family